MSTIGFSEIPSLIHLCAWKISKEEFEELSPPILKERIETLRKKPVPWMMFFKYKAKRHTNFPIHSIESDLVVVSVPRKNLPNCFLAPLDKIFTEIDFTRDQDT